MSNPISRDRTRRWAGAAARDAIPDTAEHAEAVERTPRMVRKWRDGKNASPLTRFLDWLAKVENPWRIAVHVTAFCKWLKLNGRPTAELVERWWQLTDLEHDLEARENRAIANGGDAAEEILADEKEAAVQTERAAVRRILEERRVDPRDYDRRAA